ncbi:MAG: glycogen debranching enzyme, partial [Thermodesulfobacteriota bacterium]
MSKKKIPCRLDRGFPLPGGATLLDHGINFAIFSRHATEASLVVHLRQQNDRPVNPIEITLDPEINRTGDIWHIFLVTEERDFSYGFRFDGERDIQGRGL